MSQKQYIKNREQITNHGNSALRQVAADIIEAALQASDPYIATNKLIKLDGNRLLVGTLMFDLTQYERIFVFGAGKATYPIAFALEEILGNRITDGLVVLKAGYEADLQHIQFTFGAHPVPDENGHIGAKKMYDMAGACTEKDLVLTCITGGSSALLPLPVEGVSLDEKKLVNKLLLHSGADITQINACRKHLSRIKGGFLAKRLLPATIVNLTVSDVIGDPLDYITDPTVPDTSTFDDARKVLDEFGLWEKFPASAAKYIRSGGPEQETPKEEDFAGSNLHTFIVVDSAAACLGAAEKAQQMGYNTMLLTTLLKGDAKEAGSFFASIAQEIAKFNRPLQKPCAVIAGGENTVTITGQYGEGGPNQEFALSAGLEIGGLENAVVVSFDTDGTDGPTMMAGGIVDGTMQGEARKKGVELTHALRQHNVLPVLQQLDNAIITGHTGTNVNDLKLLLVS